MHSEVIKGKFPSPPTSVFWNVLILVYYRARMGILGPRFGRNHGQHVGPRDRRPLSRLLGPHARRRQHCQIRRGRRGVCSSPSFPTTPRPPTWKLKRFGGEQGGQHDGDRRTATGVGQDGRRRHVGVAARVPLATEHGSVGEAEEDVKRVRVDEEFIPTEYFSASSLPWSGVEMLGEKGMYGVEVHPPNAGRALPR